MSSSPVELGEFLRQPVSQVGVLVDVNAERVQAVLLLRLLLFPRLLSPSTPEFVPPCVLTLQNLNNHRQLRSRRRFQRKGIATSGDWVDTTCLPRGPTRKDKGRISDFGLMKPSLGLPYSRTSFCTHLVGRDSLLAQFVLFSLFLEPLVVNLTHDVREAQRVLPLLREVVFCNRTTEMYRLRHQWHRTIHINVRLFAV